MPRKKSTTTDLKTTRKPKQKREVLPVIEKEPDVCPRCKKLNTLNTYRTCKCQAMGIIARYRICKECKKRVREETPME